MKSFEQVMHLAIFVARKQRVLLPDGVSESSVRDLARKIKLGIPEQLGIWLKACNAPPIGPAGLFGICPENSFLDIEQELQLHPYWIDSGWIPIASDGAGGYYVICATKAQAGLYPILFIDERDYNNACYCVASDYFTFVWFYLQEELGEDYWPFDRERVLAIDPQLESLEGFSKPWDVG